MKGDNGAAGSYWVYVYERTKRNLIFRHEAVQRGVGGQQSDFCQILVVHQLLWVKIFPLNSEK